VGFVVKEVAGRGISPYASVALSDYHSTNAVWSLSAIEGQTIGAQQATQK